ncbi:hypothetical protein [Fangia hongkongensis]|uniref:hypothetical protein n=1 Tax=Fangia hongkongensis TaxID=270495 RepID=UPI00035EB58F|nr:hypothetical protein [Fangia hongkongensis]MBK2124845.1 hypothetical protein [Fangia hongkongensis]
MAANQYNGLSLRSLVESKYKRPIKQVFIDFREAGRTLDDVSEEFNCSPSTVRKYSTMYGFTFPIDAIAKIKRKEQEASYIEYLFNQLRLTHLNSVNFLYKAWR